MKFCIGDLNTCRIVCVKFCYFLCTQYILLLIVLWVTMAILLFFSCRQYNDNCSINNCWSSGFDRFHNYISSHQASFSIYCRFFWFTLIRWCHVENCLLFDIYVSWARCHPKWLNIHCESKRDLYTFAHNFGRCWWIFEIFPLLNSSRNLQQTDCRIAHNTLNVLLHYLVKWQLSQSHFHIKTSIVTSKITGYWLSPHSLEIWRAERWVWGLFSWLRTNSSTWVTLSSVR